MREVALSLFFLANLAKEYKKFDLVSKKIMAG